MTKSQFKANVADRGKYAEKVVFKLLTQWNGQYSDFAWHRLPDSRSARNLLAAQPADAMYFNGDYGGFLEIKTTEHQFRLPKDKLSQLPTLRKFALAGARSLVIIYHSKLDKWRIAKLEWFEGTPPSWDLTPLPLFNTAEQAMNSINWR